MQGPRLARIGRTSCLAAACLWLAGCAGISARETIFKNAARDAGERVAARRAPSRPTSDLLVRQGLLAAARDDPAAVASVLEARLTARPEPDGAFALAELNDRAALVRPVDDPRASANCRQPWQSVTLAPWAFS